VAEAIRRRVAQLEVGEGVRLTVSIGFAAVAPKPGTLVDSLVAQADAALYVAKSAGRDRVQEADPNDSMIPAGESPSGA
jgi:diguanylate cyclase (GGDEF)-like protein